MLIKYAAEMPCLQLVTHTEDTVLPARSSDSCSRGFVWNQLPRVGIITGSNDVITVPAYVFFYHLCNVAGVSKAHDPEQTMMYTHTIGQKNNRNGHDACIGHFLRHRLHHLQAKQQPVNYRVVCIRKS